MQDALKAKTCANCQSVFDFKNLRYLCLSSRRFFKSTCSKVHWDYEKPQSEEQERPICRSTQQDKVIRRAEALLREAMNSDEFETVDNAVKDIE